MSAAADDVTNGIFQLWRQFRFSLIPRCRNEFFQCNPDWDCHIYTGIWPGSRLSHLRTHSIKNHHEKAQRIWKVAIQFPANFPAKNTEKCAKFICKKHREIHFACRIVFCILISRISHCFLHINFAYFALFFAYEFDAFRSVFCMLI